MLTASAGAATGSGAAEALSAVPTSVASDTYLKAVGVDPGRLIKQQGLLNYAGPNCPGLGWTCTTATQVLQIALPGGTNIIECGDPALVGLDPATLYGTEPTAAFLGVSAGTCVGVQIQPAISSIRLGDSAKGGNSGNNNARCHERLHQKTEPYTAAQECRIVQVNTSGENHASVHMLIDQNATGTTQTAQQEAEVIQSNGTGDNHSLVTQMIKQTINGEASEQIQEAHQSACVWQGGPVAMLPATGCPTTDEKSSGDHFSQIHQQQEQSEKAKGAPSNSQEQNNDPSPVGDCDRGMQADAADMLQFDAVSDPNICANLEQHSTAGNADSHLTQLSNHDMRTDSSVGSQKQGSFEGGLDSDVDQDTPGVKKHHATLRKTQKQVAATSAVSQEKWDPSDCCATQEPPNPNDSVNIDQTATQRALVGEEVFSETSAAASNPDAFESAELHGHFVTGGDGLIKHVVSQNDGGTTQTCPPEGFNSESNACELFTDCVNGQCPPFSEGIVDARGDRVRARP
jgi:hypothetical protein